MSIELTSPAFAPNGKIPVRNTGEGDDVSPPLSWGAVPPATVELALICEDPDAPRAKPWVHYVLYRIPPTQHELAEGASIGIMGRNDFGDTAYGGPMPPPGHGTHHYHFRIYALDARVTLPPGASRDQLLAAIRGHVLDEGELVGTYERN